MHQPEICPPGHTCEVPENTGVCDNGKYAYESIACMDCPKGYYCTEGFQEICANGMKADTTGLSECELCPEGYNCADPKNPFICDEGTIPSQDHMLCYDCETGYFCTGGKSFECNAGTYCDKTGMTEPIECPFGHYCTGGSQKEECGKGKYSKKGSSQCEACNPGQLCEETVKEKPDWCPVGYHCFDPTQKVACPPGTLGTKYNLTECEDCPKGTNCDNPSEERMLLCI